MTDGVKVQMLDPSGISTPLDRMRRLRPELVDELAELIKVNGLLQPIIVRPKKIGYFLVAGRHRLEAVRKLKHDSIRAEIREGLDEDTAEIVEIEENLTRGELTEVEQAKHFARRQELYESKYGKAKARGGNAAQRKMGHKANAKMADAWTTAIAEKTGKSKRAVQRATARGKKVKVLDEIARTCLDRGDELDALAQLDGAEQKALAERAKAGEKVSAKTRVKQIRRQERETELAEKTVAAATALGQAGRRYGVIVADPEWRFEPYSQATGMDRAADNHYPTSTTDVIAARPVQGLAADDCVLFLWATVPMLREALRILEAWGFEYRSHMVWDKVRTGTGYWFRNRHELLLVGVRGNPPAPALGEQSESLLTIARGKHSAKPEQFLALIERYFPTMPKIELNRRGPPRQGWDAWGNEVEEAGDSALIEA
jgi:ParB/RepB/Spo0J family partition protein